MMNDVASLSLPQPCLASQAATPSAHFEMHEHYFTVAHIPLTSHHFNHIAYLASSSQDHDQALICPFKL